jgi:phosphomannomutase
VDSRVDDLRSHLNHQPQELRFGTSGRRAPVSHLTQLEVYINVLGELRYLQSLEGSEGGIRAGEEFFLAHDLRPSSTEYDSDHEGCGEIFQAAEQAARDSGMQPVNLGALPTPALMHYAIAAGKGSLMVTGSHIPFDRNGYKLNTSRGELLKQHEEPINCSVQQVREEIYGRAFGASIFNASGGFRSGHRELPTINPCGRIAYLKRFTEFFEGASLAGKRILVYEHSAVGRDLLVEILRHFRAEVIPAGLSAEFVPIDTENIDAGLLALIQRLASEAEAQHGPLDAVVSTDGDSDRPLVLGVANGEVRFFGGDLVGMIVAEYLGADSVVVPVSCNDAIDRGSLARITEPKTRIGSPYVIAGMEAAARRGRRRICGWEANGGFLTGSDFERHGKLLTALPTRDAMLPILGVLFSAAERNISIPELFARLPERFSRAALLKNFPRSMSGRILAEFMPAAGNGHEHNIHRLQGFFSPEAGFSPISSVDYTDGIRIRFTNGDVAHFRPSGNADEFRCYAVAGTQARADAIARLATAEPDGIMRRMERSVQ